jgi:hypothetical protein
MLEMLPYAFIRIEIWSIGRKLFYADPLCPGSRQEITDLFGARDAPTIPDDQQLLTQVSEQMPQKQSAIPSRQRTPAFINLTIYCRSAKYRTVANTIV